MSELTTPAGAATVVVSAHLDDAVLSCGGRIGPDCVVVTLFAGVPPPGSPPPPWDQLTGAVDPHARMRQRLDEDGAAVAQLGARAIHLDLLDAHYRAHDDLDTVSTVASLRELLSGVARLWLPAAIGCHPDHLAARSIGLAAGNALDLAVELYADLPYSITYGWPPWVTGKAPHPLIDAGAWLAAELAEAGLAADDLTPHVHRLDARAMARKQEAMAAYATQLPVLDAQCGGRLRDGETARFELSWSIHSTAAVASSIPS